VIFVVVDLLEAAASKIENGLETSPSLQKEVEVDEVLAAAAATKRRTMLQASGLRTLGVIAVRSQDEIPVIPGPFVGLPVSYCCTHGVLAEEATAGVNLPPITVHENPAKHPLGVLVKVILLEGSIPEERAQETSKFRS